MNDAIEWLLEYGKYTLLAAAIFFGLGGAGHEIAEGVAKIIMSSGTLVTHSMFVGKGDGPLLSISEKGISSPDATQYDIP